MNNGLRRVALFGGSFDPVHNGHLAIARSAVDQADLHSVIFLPAAKSPLRERGPVAPGEDRMDMLRAAVRGLSWAEVCGWELDRPGPSYSWETVEHFTATEKKSGGMEWFWLMGEDQWTALEHWKRWDYLAEKVTFLVFAREGSVPLRRAHVRAQFLTGEFAGSSTGIRRHLAAGNSIEGLVPPGVAELVLSRGLYANP